jgi:hypothetical protein
MISHKITCRDEHTDAIVLHGLLRRTKTHERRNHKDELLVKRGMGTLSCYPVIMEREQKQEIKNWVEKGDGNETYALRITGLFA